MAAIFASGSKKMTEGFGPKVPGFDHFKFGDLKSLKKKINNKTAAIFFETAMGESGIKVNSKKLDPVFLSSYFFRFLLRVSY